MTPKQRAFLAAFRVCGSVSVAARKARTSRSSHYEWMKTSEEYATTFDDAREEACDVLEMEAWRRAMGVETPVLYRGQPVYMRDENGKLTDQPVTIRRYGDKLLMFLLKGVRPEKYRENYKGPAKPAVPSAPRLDLSKLTDEELKTLQALVEKAARR